MRTPWRGRWMRRPPGRRGRRCGNRGWCKRRDRRRRALPRGGVCVKGGGGGCGRAAPLGRARRRWRVQVREAAGRALWHDELLREVQRLGVEVVDTEEVRAA